MPLRPSASVPTADRHRILRFCVAIFVAGTALCAPAAAAAAPAAFQVEGTLRTVEGGPVADGKYNLTFRLFEDVKAEVAVWKEIHIETPVQSGHFQSTVGEMDLNQPIPAGFFAAHPAPALSLQVSTDPELPRQRLRAVPYAIHASTADNLVGGLTGDKLAPGSLPDSALGFNYAGSNAKSGPALDLACTGCVTAAHLAAGVLEAKSIGFASGGPGATIDSALAPLAKALKADGLQIGVGKTPAGVCALDVGSDGGEVCLDGIPALWTRIVDGEAAMFALPKDGQLAYRKDLGKSFLRHKGLWREIVVKPYCGDGFAEAPEECDDGAKNADAPNACRTTCLKPTCGDTIVDAAEQCDDGNVVATDACVACKVATCGDGYLQAGVEVCDDGNTVASDACTSACKPAVCGDGFVQTGKEACDDGDANADTKDKCRTNCQAPKCGDAIVDTGEECDDGNANANTKDKCRTTRKSPKCGDGVLDTGEECDDGNDLAGDGCSPASQGNGCKVTAKTFKGYANWSQNVNGQSDAQQDAAMDAACGAAYGGAKAATIAEIIGGQLIGLPANNGSGQHLLGKCPSCSGNSNSGAVSGHCRLCVDPGTAFPKAAPAGWNPNCCNSTRGAACVL